MRLIVGLIAGLMLFGQAAPKTLTADDLKDILAKDEGVFLLDVREPKELAELGTLKGAVNVPLGEVEKRLAEIPKDRKAIVFCERARRAAKAAAILEKEGYTNVIGLAGMVEWREKKYEVVYPGK